MTTPFVFTLDWDTRPETVYPNSFSDVVPQNPRGMDRNPTIDPGPGRLHVILWPELYGLTAAGAQDLARLLAASSNALEPEAPLRFSHNILRRGFVKTLSLRAPTRMALDLQAALTNQPPALWWGVSACPDGFVSTRDAIVGTGCFAGSWDPTLFFPPRSFWQERTQHTPLGKTYTHLFSIGSVAFALGALLAWVENDTHALCATEQPFAPYVAPLQTLITQGLHLWGLDGGCQDGYDRQKALTLRGGGSLSDHYNIHTMKRTQKGRAELGEAFAKDVLYFAKRSNLFVLDKVPFPTSLSVDTNTPFVLPPKTGTQVAFDTGKQFAQHYPSNSIDALFLDGMRTLYR